MPCQESQKAGCRRCQAETSGPDREGRLSADLGAMPLVLVDATTAPHRVVPDYHMTRDQAQAVVEVERENHNVLWQRRRDIGHVRSLAELLGVAGVLDA